MSDLALTLEGALPAPGGDQRQRLKQAATQFEVEFVRLLFKDLENTPIDEEPLLGEDPGSKQFFHDGLGERAAGGLGVADLVFNELSARAGIERTPPSSLGTRSGPAPAKETP